MERKQGAGDDLRAGKRRTKTMKALKRIMLVALAAMALTMTGATEAQAAKQPGNVANIEETKVTGTSISLKFKKAKNAKKYQIRVYEAKYKRKSASAILKETNPTGRYSYTATKKLLKKGETTKTKYTIKGLKSDTGCLVKIRAVNGKKYGKWATQFMMSGMSNGIHGPGNSTASGKALEKQYEAHKKWLLKEFRDIWNAGFCDTDIKCISKSEYLPKDPNKFTKAEIHQIYKKGFGSDLEVYQYMMDMNKAAGIRCRIVRDIKVLPSDDTTYYEHDLERYALIDLDNKIQLTINSRSTYTTTVDLSTIVDLQ